ncbi:MAG: ABC transporter family substrate-binding protein, partial [Sciscionella sp.]
MAALVAPIAAMALVLSSCGGGSSGGLQGDQNFKPGAQDLNAQPASKLRDGGELKWPVDQLPDNWNRNELDGNVQDGVFMVDAM